MSKENDNLTPKEEYEKWLEKDRISNEAYDALKVILEKKILFFYEFINAHMQR